MSTDDTRPTTPGADDTADATRVEPMVEQTLPLPATADRTLPYPATGRGTDTDTAPYPATTGTDSDSDTVPYPATTGTDSDSDTVPSPPSDTVPYPAPSHAADTGRREQSTQPAPPDQPAPARHDVRPRLRVGTVVWGLVLAAIGVALLAWAAGLAIDVQLAVIVLLAVAGVALLVGSLVSGARSSRR